MIPSLPLICCMIFVLLSFVCVYIRHTIRLMKGFVTFKYIGFVPSDLAQYLMYNRCCLLLYLSRYFFLTSPPPPPPDMESQTLGKERELEESLSLPFILPSLLSTKCLNISTLSTPEVYPAFTFMALMKLTIRVALWRIAWGFILIMVLIFVTNF